MMGLMFQWIGFNFPDFLQNLDNIGFFQYVLPFLLIFAVVFAILGEIPIFKEKKGPAVIVALAIGLLSLQLNIVPAFFQTVFPNFGIGLSLLIVALILAGAFISGETAYKWIFFGIGALIFIAVMFSSLSDIHFIGSDWWNMYGGLLVVVVIIAGVVVAAILGTKQFDNKH